MINITGGGVSASFQAISSDGDGVTMNTNAAGELVLSTILARGGDVGLRLDGIGGMQTVAGASSVFAQGSVSGRALLLNDVTIDIFTGRLSFRQS